MESYQDVTVKWPASSGLWAAHHSSQWRGHWKHLNRGATVHQFTTARRFSQRMSGAKRYSTSESIEILSPWHPDAHSLPSSWYMKSETETHRDPWRPFPRSSTVLKFAENSYIARGCQFVEEAWCFVFPRSCKAFAVLLSHKNCLSLQDSSSRFFTKILMKECRVAGDIHDCPLVSRLLEQLIAQCT